MGADDQLAAASPSAHSSREWLSLHVFYADRQDDLLEETIGPLIADTRSAGLVDLAFFLRHWESGPHVRVRLQCVAARSSKVSEEAHQRIRLWLEKNPSNDIDKTRLEGSMRRLSELEHGSVQEFDLAPNNSVQVMTYTPETAKYGGMAGIAIAERFFSGSSRIALETIAATRHNDRSRLGQGFLVMLIGALAFGLKGCDVEDFARAYQTYWKRYIGNTEERTQAAWEQQFQVQREVLTGITAAALSGRRVGGTVGDEWWALFSDAYTDLKPLVRDGTIRPNLPPSAPPRMALNSLLANYIHTSNNRLDVRPQAEAFLAYLLMRSIQSAGDTNE
jgi:thiopeptide-type bacteriocin biosynthesis protein